MKAVEEKPGGNKMSVISMKQLLEAGVHFGHQTRRWNPKIDVYKRQDLYKNVILTKEDKKLLNSKK